MSHESHEERVCLYVNSLSHPRGFSFCNTMHMYSLVSECDEDHARTHRALAHVTNAEHLPVGRSLAVIIVGELRLSMQKMRLLLKNWVGICDQVMTNQSIPAQQHKCRLCPAYRPSIFVVDVGTRSCHTFTLPSRAVSLTRPSLLLCPCLPRSAVGRSLAEVRLPSRHSCFSAHMTRSGHISRMKI